MADLKQNKDLKVLIEYCGVCDYGGHCLALATAIKKSTPNAEVLCKRGRQEVTAKYTSTKYEFGAGSFEVLINNILVYSKLQTLALPDYEEVVDVVTDVSNGEEPRKIKGQRPINCAIS